MKNIKTLECAFEEGIYGSKFEIKLAKKSAEVLSKFLIGKSVLELGCGFGHTTIEILQKTNDIEIVDISEKFINEAKKRIPQAKFICSDWLEFNSNKIYSDIVLFRGIDYMKEPNKLLNHIKKFMDKNSLLHILIPNNKSLHRLVGFYAGIDTPFEFSENDKKVGHLQSFNLESLIYLLQKNNFKIIHQEGIGLKPLSNNEMDKLDENIQNAFVEMGNISIQNSAEVYLICKL